MQPRKRTWCALALLAASAPAVQAQGTATLTAPPQRNYSVLVGQPFTYMDLIQAKYSGLSRRQIAAIANISDKTGVSFHLIRDKVLRGATFPMLATQYGLNLNDVYSVGDEEQEISNYKQAYETTGYYALRGMKSDEMGSGGMSSSSNVSLGALPTGAPLPTGPGDVVDVALATPRLSTFVKAIEAAGLVDTLKGDGPFTIFAPDNEAFRHLPKGVLKSLLADPSALARILQYHIIAGQKINAAAAMSMTSPTSPPTLEGNTLNVTVHHGAVMINNAEVVQPDVQASNGIIHLINRVLMPPANLTP